MVRRLVTERPRSEEIEIDTSVAHAARVYDYLVGGKTNFEIDRQAAEHALSADPQGVEIARADVRANRAFLDQTVRYLARHAGVRQFLDLGSGIPTENNVHEAAQQTAPDSRVVYVDSDPIVLAHAHALLASTHEGTVRYLRQDVRDTDSVLAEASATLDFSQPVAVILVGVLYLLTDEDGPHAIVSQLMDAVPSGSYLVLSHLAAELMPEMVAQRLREAMQETFIPRSHADVARFFDGLDMLEPPGLVPLHRWRLPETEPIPSGGYEIRYYGAVGRKL
jgi:O-methyltransferase involved in polyketide biosynthesis